MKRFSVLPLTVCFISEFEDYSASSTEPIFFPSGSRAGEELCTFVLILNDNVAEATEEFTFAITPRDENTASLEYPRGTVTIEDDDSMYGSFHAIATAYIQMCKVCVISQHTICVIYTHVWSIMI